MANFLVYKFLDFFSFILFYLSSSQLLSFSASNLSSSFTFFFPIPSLLTSSSKFLIHPQLTNILSLLAFRFCHKMSKMNPNHASSSVGILAHAFTSPIHSTVSCPDLRILHFNDVYNVAGFAKEPVGGIARFESLVNHYRDGMHFREQPKLLTLFSGDCLNPSLESIFTKGMVFPSHVNSKSFGGRDRQLLTYRIGRHMVEALNRIGVEFACLGVSVPFFVLYR